MNAPQGQEQRGLCLSLQFLGHSVAMQIWKTECFLTSCMHLSIQLMLLVVAPGMGVQNQAQGNLDSPSTLQEQGLVCSFALRAWNGSLTCIRGHSAHDRFSLHCAQGSEAFWSQDIWIYKWWWCVCVLCLCNT